MSSDYQLEDTLFLPFTTRAFATGIPTALLGTPAIDIYEDVTATPIITGETLTVSLNSVVGFNMLTVTATAATGFGAGQSYTAIIQAGTVDSVSVVGEVVAHFTLDMSAAAKDLANGTDGLGAIKTDTAAILVDTGTTLDAAIAVIDTNVDQIETAVITNATGVDIAADIIAVKAETVLIVADTNELQTDDVPGLIAALNDIAAADMWAVDATTQQTQGTFGQAIGDPVADATTIYQSVATDATGDNVAVDVVAVKAETVLIVADTNELQTDNIPGSLTTLQSDTDDIQTSLPASLQGGRMNASLDAQGMEPGAVDNIWDRDAACNQTAGT